MGRLGERRRVGAVRVSEQLDEQAAVERLRRAVCGLAALGEVEARGRVGSGAALCVGGRGGEVEGHRVSRWFRAASGRRRGRGR